MARSLDAAVRTRSLQAAVDDAADGRAALRAAVALQAHIKPRIDHVASAIHRLRSTDADAAAAWDEREAARHDRALQLVRRIQRESQLDPAWSAEDAARLLGR